MSSMHGFGGDNNKFDREAARGQTLKLLALLVLIIGTGLYLLAR